MKPGPFLSHSLQSLRIPRLSFLCMSQDSTSASSSTSTNANNGYFSFIPRRNAAELVPPVPAEVIEKIRQVVQGRLAPGGQILNMYQWGSRFYLNSTSDSDYDIIAIVTGMSNITHSCEKSQNAKSVCLVFSLTLEVDDLKRL